MGSNHRCFCYLKVLNLVLQAWLICCALRGSVHFALFHSKINFAWYLFLWEETNRAFSPWFLPREMSVQYSGGCAIQWRIFSTVEEGYHQYIMHLRDISSTDEGYPSKCTENPPTHWWYPSTVLMIPFHLGDDIPALHCPDDIPNPFTVLNILHCTDDILLQYWWYPLDWRKKNCGEGKFSKI